MHVSMLFIARVLFQVTVHGFWGSFGGFWSEICIMR